MITAVTVGATSTFILDDNKWRRLVVLTNNSDEDIYVAPGPLAVSTQGIPLKANGGSLTDSPDAQGWIYKGGWTAICASGGKVLSVVEMNNP